MHTYLKVLTGVGIAGSIGGGGYAISNLLSSSNNEIADKLVKEGYTILTNTTENNAHWKEILGNYKTLSKSNPKLKFGTFTGEGTDPKPEEELARLCQELLKPSASSDTKDEDNYKKAKKWCVAPVTVADFLKEKDHKALDTGTGNTDDNQWTEKVKAIKAKDDLTIDGLTLEKTQKTTATAQDITNIKNKCKDLGAKKNHDDKYEDNLDLFSKWCSINT